MRFSFALISALLVAAQAAAAKTEPTSLQIGMHAYFYILQRPSGEVTMITLFLTRVLEMLRCQGQEP